MFSQLSDRLSNTFKNLTSVRISESNIKEALSEVRRALLEADVALPVVTAFMDAVKDKAMGVTTQKTIRPQDAFIKIVNDELIHLLGDANVPLNLKAAAPVVILMAGLQGSGKTTTSAKIAKRLMSDKKSVMLVSVDIARPAAILQLQQLGEQIGAPVYPTAATDKPAEVVKAALDAAKKAHHDILIVDTAGRLQIDATLMDELKQVHANCNPTETLLVLDSMAGQEAENIVSAFNDAVPLTGAVLSKTDGDARGGAALSLRWQTKIPIKFMGTGEKIDEIESFHPDRLASRILGMGDIVSLVEESKRKIDEQDADRMAKRLKKGLFNYNDFLKQLDQLSKLGGMKSILSKLPGGGKLPKGAAGMMDDAQIKKMRAIIQSMTKKERKFPALLNGSRKKRIAAGSGTMVPDVNKLSKQFTQMQKMLKKMQGGSQAKMMRQLQSMQGQLPPGGIPGASKMPGLEDLLGK
jgi:signal recognition particle subunit SRP54